MFLLNQFTNKFSVDNPDTNAKCMAVNNENDVVVSGIAGKYPECSSLEEFASRLYNHEDMVTEDETRWRKDLFASPMGMGKLRNLEIFDANFFGFDDNEPDSMDAQLRMLLEIVYEAIWDSGTDPLSMSGTNTGVFVGNCFDEILNAHSTIGTLPEYKQYIAAQVSHRFNFRGPSMAMDTACASSASALHEAVTNLRHNRCDSAIVAGINLGLNPIMQYQFLKLNMLSPDGRCKCLDQSANGYAKGEAVVAIVLQRKRYAKRIYATIVHTKTNNDGYEEKGITFPTWISQRDLMRQTYAEAGVNPHDVKYIEAHCTGTQAGDPEEMRAICETLCLGDRREPLLIGAHKSNMGHSEASSGMCSMSKAIISLERECIPANLHFQKANSKIEGIAAGKLRPINTNTEFQGDLVGLNNFGFGGSNIHIIIKSPKIKPKENNNKIIDKIPRLINMCGRDENTINYFFQKLLKHPKHLTRDLLSLVNDISKTSPFNSNTTSFKGMTSRGFALIDSLDENYLNNQLKQNFNVREISDNNREIWFVLSGMGSQYQAMAKDLVKIDIFEKSIKNLCEIMKKFSIDLWDLVMNEKQNICDSVMNSFLTIAAIQIGLIDLLKVLNIKPNGIIGHSIGELTCAYADQCISAEQTIVMAYWRAKCVEDNVKTRGRMAAIGLGVKQAKDICPTDVFVACDNSNDSVTVSGKTKAVEDFVKQLKSRNIFATNVESSGIAFHSPLMYPIGNQLSVKLRSVMTNTVVLPSKWISTTSKNSSFDENNNKSQGFSAQFFVDNLLFPVQFNDTLKRIPSNAVVIEISPHSLLQSIIKRSLGPNISYVPLMRKNEMNLKTFLSSVGTLYALGFNPQIEKLYPKVEYPVSTGTQFISPMIKWIHDKKYIVTEYPEYFNISQNIKSRMTKFNSMDTEDVYIMGHVIDGRNLYPGTGYLLLVWKHLAAFNNKEYDQLAVEFNDVVFHRATIVQPNRELQLQTSVDITTGEFILTESGALIVSGSIRELNREGLQYQTFLEENSFRFRQTNNLILKKQDIYTGLRLRGYDYGQSFQCVSEAFIEERKVKALIEWTNNWVVFSDNMIQIGIIGVDSKGLYIPVRLDMIRFNPKLLLEQLATMSESTDPLKLEAIFDYDTRIGVAKGLEYRGMKASFMPRNLNTQKPIVGEYGFVAYEELISRFDKEEELKQYCSVCDQMANDLDIKFHLLRKVGKNAKIISTKNDGLNELNPKIKNNYLYKFLLDLNNNFNEYSVESIKMNDNYMELNDDLLMKTIYNKWLIDTQIITIYDNKKVLGLNVLELNDSQESMYESVAESLDPHDYNVKLNYNVGYRQLTEENKSSNDSKSVEWSTNESTVPSNFKDLDLIIYKNDSNDNINFTELCQSVWLTLKANGFFQIIFRDHFTRAELFVRNLLNIKTHSMDKNQLRTDAEKCGFTYIGWNGNQFGANALLFRKMVSDFQIEKQTFIEISNNFSEWLEKLKEEIKTIHKRPEDENIWLIANNTAKNGILGLMYSLRKEVNGTRIRSIFNLSGNKDQFLTNKHEFEAIIKKDLVYNVFKDEKYGYYKISVKPSLAKTVVAEHCFLNITTKGDLSSFKWFECQHKNWPIGRKDNQLLCRVYYSALNFKDVMLATGRLPPDALPGDQALQDCILGFEFSGRDENNNRVMGMIPSKALATTCIVDDTEFLWPIPEEWTMEEAATVPCVYATAYYALILRGNLKSGEKVLIHSGSGGVGQAAINICLALDCHLYITVGSVAKRDFLKKLFPKLTDHNFSSSRDLSFKSHVMYETNGLGVDLVLNSLSDDKLKASLECLSRKGRFLEIGKYDMSVNTKLDMSELLKNKSLHGIHLDALFTIDQKTSIKVLKDRKSIRRLISDGIKSGTVKPLNRTVFNSTECEEAFRYMSSGKHMGKIVIKIRDEEPVDLIKDHQSMVSTNGYKMRAIARTVFNPNKVYIISGGLGGFGLELIDWMIEREAKIFFITSRTGPKDGYQRSKLNRYREMGADVHIVTHIDLSQPQGAATLLTTALKLGPIGGVFHLALDLVDAIFENQTESMFKQICRSKSDAIITLDICSRKLCPDVDYFVGFSSGVASRGNIGQTNYGYSNSIIDRVCELRKSSGYKALAIQWGAIGDVGIVVKSTGSDSVIIAGTSAQRIPSCLLTLDSLLQSDEAICFSFVKCEQKLESSGSKEGFLKKLGHILGMDDLKKLDPSTKMLKLGMDSLMAVEIQLAIERDFDVVLTAQEVRELTIAGIVEIVTGSGA